MARLLDFITLRTQLITHEIVKRIFAKVATRIIICRTDCRSSFVLISSPASVSGGPTRFYVQFSPTEQYWYFTIFRVLKLLKWIKSVNEVSRLGYETEGMYVRWTVLATFRRRRRRYSKFGTVKHTLVY